ncbi:MAG: hypothetical protein R3C49_19190 [Planctomycetaceae bacterium]
MKDEQFVVNDSRFDNPYGMPTTQRPVLPHSGPGIASFVTSLFAGMSLLGLLVLTIVVLGPNPDAVPDDDPKLIIIGLSGIFAMMLMVVSIVLALVALFQPDRRKLFAILGLTLNFLLIVVFGGLVVLGSME